MEFLDHEKMKQANCERSQGEIKPVEMTEHVDLLSKMFKCGSRKAQKVWLMNFKLRITV
jgi:hypothetical protein